ncbi:MAG TPA: DNA-processing protein DprA, partial [Lachnospiraceae bacterium]|nr:DNA-processing protein DprA [Lachnospiraceae bacterium]
MERTNNEYLYWLCNLKGIGNRKVSILLNTFGSAKEVYYAKEDTLRQIQDITDKDRYMLLKNKDLGRVHISYANLLEKGIYFLTKEDNNYPERLKNIYDAPNALYLKGNLLKNEKKTIAIVGARNCSGYGIDSARYFARELS